MRNLLVFIVICSSTLVFSQQNIELKKKYLGSYKGTIPAYKIRSDYDLIEVSETPIYVHLMKDEVTITIGSKTQKGTYEVLFQADGYYLVNATMEDQLVSERILVYKRGKHISREGMYPQPATELDKFKGR